MKYQKDDLIVYGNAGVYRVKEIGPLSGISCADKGRNYYVLKPVFGEGTVYYPVDGSKIFTRPVISREKVEELIAMIPSIKSEEVEADNTQELTEQYRSAFDSHSCADLIELLISIYSKKRRVTEQKRKFGQIDENYMKQAENQLYSEFGAVLGIDKDDVPDYIRSRVETAG